MILCLCSFLFSSYFLLVGENEGGSSYVATFRSPLFVLVLYILSYFRTWFSDQSVVVTTTTTAKYLGKTTTPLQLLKLFSFPLIYSSLPRILSISLTLSYNLYSLFIVSNALLSSYSFSLPAQHYGNATASRRWLKSSWRRKKSSPLITFRMRKTFVSCF